ncbi:transposase [Paenibacillus sp. PvR052]|nr:transposase [Paenibacillus sp. PvP091]MBP1169763.1 transposase [Paenibacillus sp. PvR098]MBP2440791.1 transposase [Paenibacillus sp. PvP052]
MGITKGAKRRQRTNEYIIIEQLSPSYSVTLLCELAGVSRSGYYKWLQNKENKSANQIENEIIMQKIMECHTKLRAIYGYPRIQVWLQKTYGLRVNHKRVYHLMKLLGIRSRIRRKRPYYGRQEAYVISKNTLNRDFQASRPNEKWVTDITYLL